LGAVQDKRQSLIDFEHYQHFIRNAAEVYAVTVNILGIRCEKDGFGLGDLRPRNIVDILSVERDTALVKRTLFSSFNSG
jgi:hypothetical protein